MKGNNPQSDLASWLRWHWGEKLWCLSRNEYIRFLGWTEEGQAKIGCEALGYLGIVSPSDLKRDEYKPRTTEFDKDIVPSQAFLDACTEARKMIESDPFKERGKK